MKNERSLFYGRFMVVAKLENSFKDEKGQDVEYAEMTLSTGKVTIKANVMKNNEAFSCEFGKWYNFEMSANTASGGNERYTKYKINAIASDQDILEYFGLQLPFDKSAAGKTKDAQKSFV